MMRRKSEYEKEIDLEIYSADMDGLRDCLVRKGRERRYWAERSKEL